ncbi:conserved hypothetical protein [Leishmania braziliensis MHOM/BR/75/M2904]|uniref:Clu domain-containing protein n=1 Tax=Leishmania braziliensis TaxID=5660 RepID=A4HKE3_LEIBR|nr:conserved hypothetical protein [Leishmania braziliensis MHOM/BR/75/M2904]CAJ2478597.1 unnamed protein product [Leishmania braziliensis]CAM42968.2 conserved hypothetical protein [Leishmania braziliensis MHOM/BR/75/M2904]
MSSQRSVGQGACTGSIAFPSKPPRLPRRTDNTAPMTPRQRPTLSPEKKLSLIDKVSLAASPSLPFPAPPSRPPRRSRSPVYWGATKEAPFYGGPLGEVIGRVPTGTVLLEASRYRDVFGGWWISTRCDDGTLGWIAYSDSTEAPAADDAGAVPLWHRVYDTRATPAAAAVSADALPSTEMRMCDVLPSVTCEDVSRTAAAHFLFSDVELYAYYWDVVHPQERTTLDWNFEYQRLVELCWHATDVSHPVTSSSSTLSSAPAVTGPHAQLGTIIAAFRSEVERTIVQIWKEAVVPPGSRQIVAHPCFPDQVYFHRGILLRRCVDTADGVLGGDDMAMRCGRAIYRHQEMLALVAPRHVLHVPLHAYCTFGGFSFLCSTIPPYGTANLVVADSNTLAATGSTDTLSAFPPTSLSTRPALVSELLSNLGNALHFEGGNVPCEWRVYAGRDRRLYLSQTHRLLPPVLPLHCRNLSNTVSSSPSKASDEVVGASCASSLYASLLCYCVRPELFFRWQNLWAPNECVCTPCELTKRASSGQACRSKVVASQSFAAGTWISSEGITRVAGTLGFQFPVAAPLLPVECCNLCDGGIDANELRFVVCTHPLQCCRVCMHCYTRLVLEHTGEGGAPVDPLEQVCPTAVRCGAGCRKAGSFLMAPTLSELMHANGLNMRYLAYVLHRIPQTTRAAVEHWCHVELVARTAKHLLQQDLRAATTPVETRTACEALLASLVGPSGGASERFWRTRLGPALQSRFVGTCEPFRLSVHALRLVAERVAALVGVTLSESCLSSLSLLGATTKRATAGRRSDRETGGNSREAESLLTAAATDATGAFIEIKRIAPQTRTFAAPHRRPFSPSPTTSEDAGANANQEMVVPIKHRVERLLLFWVGYTPDGVNEAQQPFYLEESLLQTTLFATETR